MDVVRTPATGWIEVIVGSMFSGKSEELIRRLRRAQIARQRVQIFKPVGRHALRRRPHRVAQRAADPVGERARPRPICWRRCGPTPKWSASTKGSSSTPSCRRSRSELARARRARDRRRARPGLPRQAVRADAATAGDRRIHHQDARHLHGVRQSRQPHAAPGRQLRSRAARRAGHLRGALPALLRSDAVARRRNAAPSRKRPGRRDDGRRSLPRHCGRFCSALGLLFVIVNLRVGWQIVSWWRRRAQARRDVAAAEAAVLRDQPRDRRAARHPAVRDAYVVIPAARGWPARRCSAW